MNIDLKPFMKNGELERYGEDIVDSIVDNDDFVRENSLACEALEGSVNDRGFVAESVEMTKQQAQAFASLLAEVCFNDFEHNSWDGNIGPVVRVFMDSEYMNEIAALNKYGKDLQTNIDFDDVDFS